jgi:hypothetical protein
MFQPILRKNHKYFDHIFRQLQQLKQDAGLVVKETYELHKSGFSSGILKKRGGGYWEVSIFPFKPKRALLSVICWFFFGRKYKKLKSK